MFSRPHRHCVTLPRNVTAAAALFVLAACAPKEPPPPPKPDLGGILRKAVDQHRVPGVVAMVATGAAITYEGAAGMPQDAIFAIASMTKPVTAVAVMQLVEAGKIALDEPAATYLPELKKVQVLEAGKLRPPRSAPTVRQLLSHTAGYGYEFLNRDLMEASRKGMFQSIQNPGDGFLKAPLVFDPGTRWEYGISTDWLGKLVERISGQSLEAYFREKIFAPLGMNDSFFDVPPEKQSRVAKIYQRQPDGSVAPSTSPAPKSVGFYSGGGGLNSTAADYLKFARAILGGGQLGAARILKTETVDAMGKNQIGDLELRRFSSMVPQLAKDNASAPGNLDKFGLGFALNSKAIPNGRGANTMSWLGIFNTFFWVDREKNICAVLLTQMLPGLDDGAAALIQDFDRAVYEGGK